MSTPTQTPEQWDEKINEIESALSNAHMQVRSCTERRNLTARKLDEAVRNWNADFPIKTAIDVHRENCARDTERKLALSAAGLPPEYKGEAPIIRSVIDEIARGGRGSVNKRYNQAFRRGSHGSHLLGTQVKLPSDK